MSNLLVDLGFPELYVSKLGACVGQMDRQTDGMQCIMWRGLH